MRLIQRLATYWLDVKLGLRMLVKYPGLALASGLGIAVTVAIATGGFSVVYGTFLAPALPIEEGERLVSIEVWDSAAGKPEPRILRDFQKWRQTLKAVEEISAFRTLTPNLIAPGAEPTSVRVAAMSASGFRLARVRPLLGRYLEERDEHEGAPSVVVIGEGIWRNRFGGDRGILGRTIQLGATVHTVVGVMPESFAFPVNHRFWVPLRTGAARAEQLTGPGITVFGRLAPGATLAGAQAELAATFTSIYPQLTARVLPYARPFMGLHQAADVAGAQMMQGFMMMLLVLVCLNVAILVYTRTATRQPEIALRLLLGASRGRVVTQLFVEALVLSAVAATVGVGVAALALRGVSAAVAPLAAELPFWISFQLSPGAVLYAGALSVLAAAIIGIVPALQATGLKVQLGKTWTVLIVAQVGFAVALLPPAVFNTWQEARASVAGPGFAAGEFLSAQLTMDAEDTGRYAGRQQELMRRLEAEPRVSAVTFAAEDPGDEPGVRVETDGGVFEVRANRVAVSFFRTFEVPVLAGRDFVAADAVEGGAVVVNRALAQRMFGGNALGKRIRYADESGRWYEIAGIVPDFPSGVSPKMDETPLMVYHAMAVGQVQPVILAVHVRGGESSTFARRMREVTAGLDPGLQLRDLRTLEEALRSEQWLSRVQAGVFAGVTVSVLLLSSAGIYALMSFTVSQRRKEIAIRTALGADKVRIFASVFSRALGQLAIGAALGGVSGVLLEQASGENFLRGNVATVLPLVALFMMAVGSLATLGPVRRCLRIEPTEALKEQRGAAR